MGHWKYIDVHRHGAEEDEADVAAVLSCGVDDDIEGLRFCSVGIHPWMVDEAWPRQMDRLRVLADRPQVVAVGECGLDRLRGADMEVQAACFGAQLELAAQVGKPVVVHCVRAWDVLLRIARGRRVIVHGFRGKPELAASLLAAGFELSFGPRFQAESLSLAYEARKMWLETDESGVPIGDVYALASRALSISPTDIELPGTLTL